MTSVLRCARCGYAYRDSENGDAACVYHPGRLRDYDLLAQPGLGSAGDFWECCMRQIQGDEPALALPGCATGRHVEAAPDDPGPVRREIARNQATLQELIGRGHWGPTPKDVEAARERLGRFLDGTAGDPAYPSGAARDDTRVMEGEDFSWLLRQLIAAGPAREQGRLIAGFLANRQNIELVRRGTALGPP